MDNVLTTNDIYWISSLILNNNTKYDYEFEIRFLNINKDIYLNNLNHFEELLKENEYNFEKKIVNIYEEINYNKNFNLIKRSQNNKQEYIMKKRIKWKYLDSIPASMNLSTELICDKPFNINNNFEKRFKKRISFISKYLSYDFTIINNNEYSIEIELLNLEYVKNTDIIISSIKEVLYYIPINNYILHKLNSYKVKSIMNQPIPLKDKNIVKDNFFVTPKFDGVRSILFIDEKKNVFLIKNSFRTIVHTNLICINTSNTIIDGELIDEKIFYAIDLIFYNNDSLETYNLKKRIDVLKTIKFKYKDNKDIYYKIKKYYFDNILETSKKLLKKKYSYTLNKKKHQILIDGLIFNSIKENYKNCIVFKWKPNITFDFKIKKRGKIISKYYGNFIVIHIIKSI